MGFLTDNFIADLFSSLFHWAAQFISDYALLIILVTLLVKFVLLPVDLMQKKNSRRMLLLAPEVESLKKRYANNPNQLNRKMQDLYKQNGVKTAAGCLPLLLQMILLFAFFGALRAIAAGQTMSLVLQAAEHGGSAIKLPSLLWVHNLWQPDSGLAAPMPSAAEFLSFLRTNSTYITPQALSILKNHGILTFANGAMGVNEATYSALTNELIAANGLTGVANGWFGLPIVAGVSLFFQQWFMTKNGQNPQQQETGKMMLYLFPLLSVYICATSNAAFALYWVASNLFSLAVSLIAEWVYREKGKKQPAPVRKN